MAAALPSGSGQGWLPSATISDDEPITALARNTSSIAVRAVEADVANRQAREVHPDLAGAGAQLQHEIVRTRAGTSNCLRHGALTDAGSPTRAS